MSDCIRLAIIDDHPLFREGVAQTVRDASDMTVVGQGSSAQDAIRIVTTLAPDIITLDVSMPGGGIEAAREIQRSGAAVKMVMLTVSENENDVVTALQAGVDGYALKGCSGPELLQVLRSVHNCETYITSALAARPLARTKQPVASANEAPDVASLTYRENQVLQLLSMGLMNREIGQSLKITEKTVKHHMTELMQKLNARNRVEAVLIARKKTGAVDQGLSNRL
jgi:two-component system, NarL family, nitrate/nitrite response regulator NarL